MRRRRRFEDDGMPLDEETQQEVIETFEVDALEQEAWFRLLFSGLLLLPTPTFVFLPYCRKEPTFSLAALLVCVGSAYALKYHKRPVMLATATLSGLVAFHALIKHWPLSIGDYVWFIPATGSATGLILEYWFGQVQVEIERLKGVRYYLRGA